MYAILLIRWGAGLYTSDQSRSISFDHRYARNTLLTVIIQNFPIVSALGTARTIMSFANLAEYGPRPQTSGVVWLRNIRHISGVSFKFRLPRHYGSRNAFWNCPWHKWHRLQSAIRDSCLFSSLVTFFSLVCLLSSHFNMGFHFTKGVYRLPETIYWEFSIFQRKLTHVYIPSCRPPLMGIQPSYISHVVLVHHTNLEHC